MSDQQQDIIDYYKPTEFDLDVSFQIHYSSDAAELSGMTFLENLIPLHHDAG